MTVADGKERIDRRGHRLGVRCPLAARWRARLHDRRRRLVPGRPAGPRPGDADAAHVGVVGARRTAAPCSGSRLCRHRTPPLIAHPRVHDGLVDLVVSPLDGVAPRKGRGQASPPRRAVATANGDGIQPWPGVWRTIGWLPDGGWIAAVGESETRPQDLWLLPVPGKAPEGARPRQLTELPARRSSAAAVARFPAGERVAHHRPRRPAPRGDAVATGDRDRAARRGQGARDRLPPRRTDLAGLPHVAAVQAAPRPTTASPSSISTSAARPGTAGRSARRITASGATPTSHDVHDAGHWLAEQGWCDGRLGVWGGSYGGYLVLGALVEEPDLWRAGIDLFGDSEIAESYRHGDRPGRHRPAAPDGQARRSRARAAATVAARRSTGPSSSRRRCSSSTAARTSGSCHS